jgi:hypothetical protein
LPDPAEQALQAKAARVHTREQFLEAVDQGQEVRRLLNRMAGHARQNHFGEGLEWLWTRSEK